MTGNSTAAAGVNVGQRPVKGWTGQSLPRDEDRQLLTGRGRYIDDIGVSTRTAEAAILRSPHGHARLLGIDASKALALPGIHAVITARGSALWLVSCRRA